MAEWGSSGPRIPKTRAGPQTVAFNHEAGDQPFYPGVPLTPSQKPLATGLQGQQVFLGRFCCLVA